MEIEVVDSLMGNGKTHVTLRYIENEAIRNSKERWIYCTEYLDEIDKRTTENAEALHLWRTPAEGDKTDKLIELLKEPNVQLIAITHSLLFLASKNTYINYLIKSKGYNLFLDETIELISPYNGCKYGDFLTWLAEGKVKVVEPYGRVEWTYKDEFSQGYGTTFERLAEDSKTGGVHCSLASGRVGTSVSLVKIEDDIVFKQFGRVIVATYQIENTLFDAYLKIKGLNRVACKDIVCNMSTTKDDIKNIVTIIKKHNKKFKDKNLSSTWWDGKGKEAATSEDFKLVNSTIRNIGDSTGCKGNAHLLGFTVPSGKIGSSRDAKAIYPKGYPHTVCYVDADEFGEEFVTSVKNKAVSTYIPCNARASNAYSNKTVMVHAYNRYPLLSVSKYLDAHNVVYSSEVFALNELLQWLWRSAIRNREPIHVAILSERMLKLFENWLGNYYVQNG